VVPSAFAARALALLACLAVVARTAEARAAPRGGVVVDDALVDGELDVEDLVGRGYGGRAVLPRAPGGDTWVSLLGYTRSSVGGEREVGGFVVVGLPFDRMARGSRPARALPPAIATLPSFERVSFAAPTSATTSGPPAPTAGGAAPPAASESSELALTPRLARSAVAAAWRAAGLGADDERLDAIAARARWAAALPEARLRALRDVDERLYTEASTDATRLRDSAGANLGLEARLTWRLDRLVYADDEPAFERIRMERHDARSRIAARVLDALFHWQRASLELRWAQSAARDARETIRTRDEVEAGLRVAEAEASLDVLTAGWFSAFRGPPRAPGSRSAAPVPAAEAL